MVARYPEYCLFHLANNSAVSFSAVRAVKLHVLQRYFTNKTGNFDALVALTGSLHFFRYDQNINK